MNEVWLEQVAGSQAIDRIGYDPAERQLLVRFTSGGTYVYFEVPQDVAQGFHAARSKGTYFHAEVLDRFAFRRMG